MQNFRQLRVWKQSMHLARACYAVTETFPNGERFGLTSQIRRASVSVASNVAEGCGRDTHPEFTRFLRIAYGSACEVETQLQLAWDLGIGDLPALRDAIDEADDVRRMLTGLIRSTRAAAVRSGSRQTSR